MSRKNEYNKIYYRNNIDLIRKKNRENAQERRGVNITFPPTCIPELGLIVKSKYFEKKDAIVLTFTEGSVQSKGYRRILIKGKWVYVHRFIWEFVNGPIPPNITIDHINHDKKDNRIQNLRLVSNTDNHRNMPLNALNSSGQMGVYFAKDRNKWVAQINIANKTKYLGSFTNINDAINVRKEAELMHNYHKNHGLCVL